MKCIQCGNEFEGKFCPECGARVDVPSPTVLPVSQEPSVYQPMPAPPDAGKGRKQRKKKPFYRRWWFILLAILAILVVVGKVKDAAESRIDWNDVALMDVIPTPPSKTGRVHENSDEKLWTSLEGVSDAQYNGYLEECINSGFTVDADKASSSYKAYNADGYCLDMSHIGENLSITVEAPMELGTIEWPSGTAGNLLPTPESTTGKFSFEHDDSFFVYIGDMSKADYDAYVSVCADEGFDVDYSKGDTYYNADNADGWHISLKYEGNSIMTVRIDAPEDETAEAETPEFESPKTEDAETIETTTEETTLETAEETTEEAVEARSASGLDPDFKAAMDAYEAFYAEYCDFMKKYSENSADLTLIAKYADMMAQALEMDEAFDAWGEDELNDEEWAYYFEVNAHVLEMLADTAVW